MVLVAGDVYEAATSGDRRATLEALRDTLAEAIATSPGNQHLPNLARQLVAVLAELEAIPNTLEVSNADEIAQRRASRRGSHAKDQARPKRSG